MLSKAVLNCIPFVHSGIRESRNIGGPDRSRGEEVGFESIRNQQSFLHVVRYIIQRAEYTEELS
jgi:hypothetical protein